MLNDSWNLLPRFPGSSILETYSKTGPRIYDSIHMVTQVTRATRI